MSSADSIRAELQESSSLQSHFLKAQLDPGVWIRLRITKEALETVVCVCPPAVAISGIRQGPAITPNSAQLV